MKPKGLKKQRYAAGVQKDTPLVDEIKFARKLANCNPTEYAGQYCRSTSSMPNPALRADRYSVDEFRHNYLLYNVLRKYNVVDEASNKARADNAFAKFLDVDKGLGQLSSSLNFYTLALNEPVAHQILWRASRKICKLLGTPDLAEIRDSVGFSHGATMLHKRREGRPPYKYSFEYPEVTPACARLAWAFIQSSPIWSQTVKGLTLVDGNRLTTVPKDAEIDRVIACEPTMNMYIQKGIGGVIRNKLRRVGINLNDQSINQRLAKAGSIEGHLATVDLSAASDSISLAICKLLLPESWYDLLLTTRSDIGILPDGTHVTYNKISSMGNGFTFELETLLFWAITQACEDEVALSRGRKTHQCSVYGDDIVCRTDTVPLLKLCLGISGFKLNVEKSFYYGPFRESCGKHYFNGIDVSPFFVRGRVSSPLDLIRLCNQLRRWNRMTLGVDDPRYVDLYAWCVRRLPVKWQKPTIPDGFGDGALFGDLAEVKPNFRKSVYKAAVLTIKERTGQIPNKDTPVTPRTKQLAAIDQVFNGLGGYIAAQANTDRIQDIPEWADTNSICYGSGAVPSSSPSSTRVPIPGDLVTRQESVKLWEWSDLSRS